MVGCSWNRSFAVRTLLAPDSFTTDSCSKNEGDSGDMYENTGGRIRESGVGRTRPSKYGLWNCDLAKVERPIPNRRSGDGLFWLLTPLLPTPALKMKVTPGMLMKTQEAEYGSQENESSKPRILELRSGDGGTTQSKSNIPARAGPAPDSFATGSCSKNEDDSGDMYENTGGRIWKSGVGRTRPSKYGLWNPDLAKVERPIPHRSSEDGRFWLLTPALKMKVTPGILMKTKGRVWDRIRSRHANAELVGEKGLSGLIPFSPRFLLPQP